MRAYQDRTFDPGKEVIARRPFIAAGRHYKPGDLFDWKRLSVAQRRVHQLFDQGKLMHGDERKMPARKQAMPQQPDPVTGPNPDEEGDELDDIDDMNELRRIAVEEGAATTVSKSRQRELIRENRAVN